MRIALSAALLALTLTACGEGDSQGGGSEDELRSTAEDFFVAFFEPNIDTVYDLTSARCKETTSKEELGAALDLAAELYGQVEVEITNVEVNGDEGDVDATTGIPALDEERGNGGEPSWVYEDGRWKSNSCSS